MVYLFIFLIKLIKLSVFIGFPVEQLFNRTNDRSRSYISMNHNPIDSEYGPM